MDSAAPRETPQQDRAAPVAFRDGSTVYVTTRTPSSIITAVSGDSTVTQLVFGPGIYRGQYQLGSRPDGFPILTIQGGSQWGAVFRPTRFQRLLRRFGVKVRGPFRFPSHD